MKQKQSFLRNYCLGLGNMNISLLPKKDLLHAQKDLSVDLVEVYNLGVDLLDRLWGKNLGLLDEFRFVYRREKEESGWFTYTVEGDDYKKITVNLAKIRTYRDLVYTILHEWRHARQYTDYGREAMRLLTRDSDDEKYAYSRIERDADSYAFRQEEKLRYKNSVINPEAPYSIFIERKKTAAYDS